MPSLPAALIIYCCIPFLWKAGEGVFEDEVAGEGNYAKESRSGKFCYL
jgi:hypothetical protein